MPKFKEDDKVLFIDQFGHIKRGIVKRWNPHKDFVYSSNGHEMFIQKGPYGPSEPEGDCDGIRVENVVLISDPEAESYKKIKEIQIKVVEQMIESAKEDVCYAENALAHTLRHLRELRGA